jgi:micrococcal nuclease
VVDGDTIVVAFAQKEYEVRYIGMGSPGTADASSPVPGAGPQALAANKALVDGKTVILEKDVSETDQDGRLLRYVWLTDGLSWTLVNLELIKKGLVSVATNMPDVKYVGTYLAAERKAQATAAGLWRADPTVKPAAKPRPKPNPQPKPKSTPKPKPTKCHPSQDAQPPGEGHANACP